jgi:hypothetical protein
MGSVTQCDFCRSIEEDTEKRGSIILRDYCRACQGVYDHYRKQLDELHTEVAREFEIGRTELLEEVMAEYPDAAFAL